MSFRFHLQDTCRSIAPEKHIADIDIEIDVDADANADDDDDDVAGYILEYFMSLDKVRERGKKKEGKKNSKMIRKQKKLKSKTDVAYICYDM
jgi:hypothetical protein